MKIATYNVWNSECGMPFRRQYIIHEIRAADADVLCLQEIRSKWMAEEIASKAGYPYCFFDHYKNEEGLCVLSRISFAECDSWLGTANAIYCSIIWKDKMWSVINLHLPWDSVVERERQIVNILNAVDGKQSDYIYMAGDFNCPDTSDVHRFLTGDCLLNRKEAKPRWYDLALAYAESTNSAVECTLDFRRNPRFVNNTIELNARYDRILLRNTYPNEFPILKSCITFGQRVYEQANLAASDHYGVMAELE